jgi:hypothetical protein
MKAAAVRSRVQSRIESRTRRGHPCSRSFRLPVFFSMDRIVGGDFEDGLNNLKTLAEAR